MNKKKELAKNTVIITVGKICTQFISFLLLPLYTSLLTTDEYGVVDLVTTYVQLLLPIIFMQMDQALFRYLIGSRNNREETIGYISNALVVLLFQIIVTIFIFIVARKIFTTNYIIYFWLNLIAIGISSYTMQIARGLGDNLSYSISSFICGVVTIALNVILIAFLHMKAEGMLVAGMVGNLAASLYIAFKIKVYNYFRINRTNRIIIKKMILYALPLIPNSLTWWVVNASDRSIVLFYLGTTFNGILAVSHKFPTLLITLYNVFHLSWTESAALHLTEDDKNNFFSSVFDVTYRFFVSMGILLIGIMPFVFNIFVNISYADAYYQIPIFTLASLFNVIVGLYSVIYISEMKTAEIAITSVMSGLINILIHIVLIRYIGLYAASISSAVAFGAMALYRAIDIRRYIKQKINFVVLFSSVCLILFGFITYYANSRYLQLAYLFIAMIYSGLINKKSYAKIVEFIRSKIKKR